MKKIFREKLSLKYNYWNYARAIENHKKSDGIDQHFIFYKK